MHIRSIFCVLRYKAWNKKISRALMNFFIHHLQLFFLAAPINFENEQRIVIFFGDNEEKKRDLASNETFFVDWNPGTFLQCFKFDCLESVATEYVNRFDVQSIDIYGYLKTGDIITRFFSISQVNHFLILSLLVIISWG